MSFWENNSPLEFCPSVRLLAVSAAVRYAKGYYCTKPILVTHVDDIFGGFKQCPEYTKAIRFREFLISSGSTHTIIFNPKEKKTPFPARVQVILGRN